jgi:hypothetical protein
MQMHADARQFVLHVDTDVIAQEEFPAVNVPGSGGLAFADVRSALIEFVKNPNLLGLDVAQYNPDKDSDSSGAKKLVDLLVEALTARLQAIGDGEATTVTSPSSGASSAAPETEDVTAPVAQVSDASTEENGSSDAPNSGEESSSGISTHETNA